MVRFFANKCGVEIRGEAVPPERAGRLDPRTQLVLERRYRRGAERFPSVIAQEALPGLPGRT
jgi:hypothetical protein